MQETCENCEYFYQHYVKRPHKAKRKDYCEVDCGHCWFPGIKHRSPQTKACKHFMARPEKAEANAEQEK